MGKTFKSGHHFPKEFGFSGSAGVCHVRPHTRAYAKGGQVRESATLTVQPSNDEAIETGFAGKRLRPGYKSGGKVDLAMMRGDKADRGMTSRAGGGKIKPPRSKAPPQNPAPAPKRVPAFNAKPVVQGADFAMRARLPGGK